MNEYCDMARYPACPPELSVEYAGNSATYEHTITNERTITCNIGTLLLTIQTRSRNFTFSSASQSAQTGCIRLTIPAVGSMLCSCSESSSTSSTFVEEYTTHDTELLYLDLRNNVVVTKEIKDTITTPENKAPTPTVSVFTGYDSQPYYPYIFDSFPISEEIKYFLHINGEKKELNTESVGRGYPDANILMPTFPTSAFGIRIDTEWAKEIEWYRSDLRKAEDGDSYLFWPDWCQSAGQLSQALDKFNRDLRYMNVKDGGSDSFPEIPTAKEFMGSVAFDPDKNVFYSIAVPKNEYSANNTFAITNALIIKGIDTPVPKEKITVEGVKQELEATCYYPIAPL